MNSDSIHELGKRYGDFATDRAGKDKIIADVLGALLGYVWGTGAIRLTEGEELRSKIKQIAGVPPTEQH